MTRILYLVDGLGVGGAERQLSLLLKYLPSGWEARVVSLRDGPFQQVLLDQGTSVTVYQRRSRFDLKPIFRLYEEIVRYKPDIVHSWGWLSSALSAPICRLFGIHLIDGSIRIAGGYNGRYWRTRVTFALADCIVANSYAGLSAYRTPPHKSSVVYNAIDPDRLDRLEHRPAVERDEVSVVMTGRISPLKDFRSFFTAARRLDADEPGCWKFIAIGGGSEKDRQSFVKLAEDLGTGGVVDLPQAGLEVFAYLQQASIGVLLSAARFKEGISNSIMEYMACGLPVICSDSGGNRELVIDGETGFIVPPEDVDSLVGKLLFLKEHPDVARRMGQEGRKRLNSLCSIERMVGDYERLYTELLARRSTWSTALHLSETRMGEGRVERQ
jgi:glycosyltransferase involved in cell wall biosynthesis